MVLNLADTERAQLVAELRRERAQLVAELRRERFGAVPWWGAIHPTYSRPRPVANPRDLQRQTDTPAETARRQRELCEALDSRNGRAVPAGQAA